MSTAVEAPTLFDLERTIDIALTEYRQAMDSINDDMTAGAEALIRIRDAKLYKSETCPNFATYCQDRWGMTVARTNALLVYGRQLESGATPKSLGEAKRAQSAANAAKDKPLGRPKKAASQTEVIDTTAREAGPVTTTKAVPEGDVSLWFDANDMALITKAAAVENLSVVSFCKLAVITRARGGKTAVPAKKAPAKAASKPKAAKEVTPNMKKAKP